MTEYYTLPQLYTFHNFDRCITMTQSHPKEADYCVVETEIVPNETSTVWKTILKYSNDTKRHFRHDKLEFGLCRSVCGQLLEKYERFYLEDNLYVGRGESSVSVFLSMINKRLKKFCSCSM